MTLRIARGAAGVACVCVLALVACGKRGNPMPPLQRIPAPPADLVVARFDDQVFAQVTAPATNIDGVRPSDVARVDLYAITIDRDPRVLGGVPQEELRKLSTLVASEHVRRPVPPALPPKEGQAPAPEVPLEPGVDQGAVIVLREALTAAMSTPAVLPEVDEPEKPADADAADVPRPLVAPIAQPGPQRYYYAVSVSARGRHSPHTGFVSVPLASTSGAPSKPVIEIAENAMTIRWTASPDARGQSPPADPEVLPSRSLVPVSPATTYEVFEVKGNAAPDAPLAVPTPLTPSPVSATEWTQPNITLGTERCFFIRPVDALEGTHY